MNGKEYECSAFKPNPIMTLFAERHIF